MHQMIGQQIPFTHPLDCIAADSGWGVAPDMGNSAESQETSTVDCFIIFMERDWNRILQILISVFSGQQEHRGLCLLFKYFISGFLEEIAFLLKTGKE